MELLLVIAIIGLLSSLVIVSVRESRGKARLATIQQEVKSIFNVSEIYYASNQKFTLAESVDVSECPDAVATNWGVLGTSGVTTVLNDLKQKAGNIGTQCAVNGSSWAIAIGVSSITLSASDPNIAFAAPAYGGICIDSKKNIVMENSENEDFYQSMINGGVDTGFSCE